MHFPEFHSQYTYNYSTGYSVNISISGFKKHIKITQVNLIYLSAPIILCVGQAFHYSPENDFLYI